MEREAGTINSTRFECLPFVSKRLLVAALADGSSGDFSLRGGTADKGERATVAGKQLRK